MNINKIKIRSQLLGKMYLSTSVFFPAMIGNIWGFIMPSKITNYVSNGITLLAIESYYRSGDSYVWQLISSSKLIRTGLFMTFSALILETHSTTRTCKWSKNDVFWFIKAYPPAETWQVEPQSSPIMNNLVTTTKLVCSHHGSCDAYIMKGIKSNLKLGLAIEMARTLLANLSQLQAHPTQLFNLFSKMKFGLVAFFVSYTTSYRVSKKIYRKSVSIKCFPIFIAAYRL